tara:strand:- start:144 stop:377 length:234 start_codon:yes stop_codon:yes gene_type:complete
MIPLKIFVLIGVIDSLDANFATVELNLNPATNGGPSVAVIPVNAFPCTIYEGKRFFVVKLEESQDSMIICDHEQEKK